MPRKIVRATKKTKTSDGSLSAYLLLDRSGSMQNRMAEAVSSINAYVQELANGCISAEVTLCAFDDFAKGLWDGKDRLQFEVVRRRVRSKDWAPVSLEEVTPRGGTPLYDAIDRIVMAAEIEGEKHTVIAIMTDGYENASKRVSRDQAKAILDKCRSRGWQVVFLGADFDAFAQSGWVGVSSGQTITFAQNHYGAAMRGLATQSVNYTTTGQNIAFSQKDRAVASGKTA